MAGMGWLVRGCQATHSSAAIAGLLRASRVASGAAERPQEPVRYFCAGPHSGNPILAAVTTSPGSAGTPAGVPIIGASGALGFGLAVRLGRAGVPVIIGSRDAGRAAEAAD